MSLCHIQVGLFASSVWCSRSCWNWPTPTDGNGLNTSFLCCRIFRFFTMLPFFFSQRCLKFLKYFCCYVLLKPTILPMLHCSGAWTASLCLTKVSHPAPLSNFLLFIESVTEVI
jgi:hypothetical protein